MVFDKKIVLDEVSDCLEEFEKDLVTVLGGIIYEDYNIDKVVCEDTEIEVEEYIIQIGKIKVPLSLIWIICGLIFFAMFKSIIWIILYSCIAVFSVYEVNTTKISNNQKKKNNSREVLK